MQQSPEYEMHYMQIETPLEFSKHAETVFFVQKTSCKVCKKMHLHKNPVSTYKQSLGFF